MDWSEKVLCIKCNEGGNLLVCNEDGCPLAVHESCMGCPARYDDAGRYYCPYCFYKKAVAESRKLREYALAKKKVLLLFMNEKMMMGREDIIACNNGSKVNSDAKEQKIGNAEEEKVQQEASSGSKGGDPSPEMDDEQSIGNEVDKKSQQEESGGSSGSKCPKLGDEESISSEEETSNLERKHKISAASSGRNCSRSKHNIRDLEEERIQEDASSPSTGEGLKGTTKRKKPLERGPQRKSSRSSPSALQTKKGSNEVVGIFGKGKRRRLFWTEKEEEALKEGVEIFSKEANINIPWRKILHMGRGVFDATRTPRDLKDKWKIMRSK